MKKIDLKGSEQDYPQEANTFEMNPDVVVLMRGHPEYALCVEDDFTANLRKLFDTKRRLATLERNAPAKKEELVKTIHSHEFDLMNYFDGFCFKCPYCPDYEPKRLSFGDYTTLSAGSAQEIITHISSDRHRKFEFEKRFNPPKNDGETDISYCYRINEPFTHHDEKGFTCKLCDPRMKTPYIDKAKLRRHYNSAKHISKRTLIVIRDECDYDIKKLGKNRIVRAYSKNESEETEEL